MPDPLELNLEIRGNRRPARRLHVVLALLPIALLFSACRPKPPVLQPPTPSPAITSGLVGSLPSGRLIFTSDRERNSGDLYELRAGSSTPLRLTDDPAYEGRPNGLIPGDALIYESYQNGNADIILRAGEAALNLTNTPGQELSPAWAADGTQIVFSSNREGSWDLYSQNLDGSNLIHLTFDLRSELQPAWSPQGGLIAFVSDRESRWKIYLLDLAAMETRDLIPNDAFCNNTMPAWSPDGTRVAFASDRDHDWEIYIVNADGSNLTRLTYAAGADWSPVWAPDGSALAFTSYRDGNWEIYWMRADGADPINLTADPATDQFPTWLR